MQIEIPHLSIHIEGMILSTILNPTAYRIESHFHIRWLVPWKSAVLMDRHGISPPVVLCSMCETTDPNGSDARIFCADARSPRASLYHGIVYRQNIRSDWRVHRENKLDSRPSQLPIGYACSHPTNRSYRFRNSRGGCDLFLCHWRALKGTQIPILAPKENSNAFEIGMAPSHRQSASGFLRPAYGQRQTHWRAPSPSVQGIRQSHVVSFWGRWYSSNVSGCVAHSNNKYMVNTMSVNILSRLSKKQI